MVRFIQLALYANRTRSYKQELAIFLLSDEVVLGFDAGLEGVDILAFVLLYVCSYSLQYVIR